MIFCQTFFTVNSFVGLYAGMFLFLFCSCHYTLGLCDWVGGSPVAVRVIVPVVSWWF